MKTKTLLIIGLIALVLLVGCTKGSNIADTPSYQQPNIQPSKGYVGGGCVVAPAEDNRDIGQLPIRNEA